jgi:alkylation response protein AidB-like acyl-CoA dehydrogenase
MRPLAEVSGWCLEIAPEVLDCAAPDTGNMETLHLFAIAQQREEWLQPLLAGEIRSGFSMNEPGRDRSPLAAAVTASPMRPKESSSYSWNLAASLI